MHISTDKKMKKNLHYTRLYGQILFIENDLVALNKHIVELLKDDLTHVSSQIEY